MLWLNSTHSNNKNYKLLRSRSKSIITHIIIIITRTSRKGFITPCKTLGLLLQSILPIMIRVKKGKNQDKNILNPSLQSSRRASNSSVQRLLNLTTYQLIMSRVQKEVQITPKKWCPETWDGVVKNSLRTIIRLIESIALKNTSD